MDAEAPLLGAQVQERSATESGSASASRSCQGQALHWKRPFVVVALIVVALVAAAVTFLAQHDAFKHIKRSIKFENGTAIEPNTGIRFPIELKNSLDGSHRRYRLYSLLLQAKHVPQIDATLRVLVIGCYCDVDNGRKELKHFKNKPVPDQNSPAFKDIIAILSSGRVSVACRRVMIMSVPGSQMHDGWLDKLRARWHARQLSSERIDALSTAFSERFNRFRNHDDFTWEFENAPGPHNGQTWVKYNEKLFDPVRDSEFGAALAATELIENGELGLNLLDEFFQGATPFNTARSLTRILQTKSATKVIAIERLAVNGCKEKAGSTNTFFSFSKNIP